MYPNIHYIYLCILKNKKRCVVAEVPQILNKNKKYAIVIFHAPHISERLFL